MNSADAEESSSSKEVISSNISGTSTASTAATRPAADLPLLGESDRRAGSQLPARSASRRGQQSSFFPGCCGMSVPTWTFCSSSSSHSGKAEAGVQPPRQMSRAEVLDDSEDADPFDGSSGADEHPNFSGSWLCVEVTGEIDRFLQDMGLDENQRLEARQNDYGAFQQRQIIKQTGSDFEILNELKASVSSKFKVRGGVQTSTDHMGRSIYIDPKWDIADSQVLVVRSYTLEGELVAYTQRCMEGDQMLLKTTSPNGSEVRRLFERRDSG